MPLLAAAAAAHLGLGCASRTVTPFEPGESRYRFSLLLSRQVGETGACAATVSVTDLAAKRKIEIPVFTAPWGKESVAAAVDSAYGARLEATVSVWADGTKGDCRAVLLRGTDLMASRTATVTVAVDKSPSKIKFR